jgi:hypothetical protein
MPGIERVSKLRFERGEMTPGRTGAADGLYPALNFAITNYSLPQAEWGMEAPEAKAVNCLNKD